ncbi:hypothetical protein ACGFWE_31350 [Streptomyces sp. NPDC048523]
MRFASCATSAAAQSIITLRSETDQDVAPEWLAGLIEKYVPGS